MSFIRRRTEAVLVGGILLALLLLQNHKNAIAAQSSPRFPLQVIPMPHPFGTPETNVTTLSSSRKNSAFPNLYHRDAYVLTSTSAWSVLVPDDDDVLQRTSLQAQRHEECRYATNGGPFHRDGSSVGTVVSNGRTIDVGTDDDFDGGSVGFGMAQLPFSQQQQQQQRSATERNSSSTSRCDTTGSLSSSHWVIGSMDSAEQWTDLGVTQFVTGFDWLVYNGTAVAANNTTGAEEAPRTAIGVNDRGILMLLVADGCEHWYVSLLMLLAVVVILEQSTGRTMTLLFAEWNLRVPV